MSKRVLVGMSGGVDSAATAYLLHQQGYEVAGATFVLWSGEETEESKCCSVDDVEDDRLGKTEPPSASKTHWGEDSK